MTALKQIAAVAVAGLLLAGCQQVDTACPISVPGVAYPICVVLVIT